MSDMSPNPLAKHFRQPSIHISLPSKGNFWPEDSIELPINGEIPVYPMTTRDEITLRTPDALMNGSGLVSVMQSCCPNIKNAWLAPSIDIDTILIAIRIASYGHSMDLETNCPKCNESNLYAVDLRKSMESVVMPDYSIPVEINGMKIMLKPQPYKSTDKISGLNYEEQKILQTLQNQTLSAEEQNAVIEAQVKRLIDLTSMLLTASTDSIITEDGIIVKDESNINEFYQNAESKITRTIQKRIEEIANEIRIKPMRVKCEKCDNEFDMSIDFNYSSFFAVGF